MDNSERALRFNQCLQQALSALREAAESTVDDRDFFLGLYLALNNFVEAKVDIALLLDEVARCNAKDTYQVAKSECEN